MEESRAGERFGVVAQYGDLCQKLMSVVEVWEEMQNSQSSGWCFWTERVVSMLLEKRRKKDKPNLGVIGIHVVSRKKQEPYRRVLEQSGREMRGRRNGMREKHGEGERRIRVNGKRAKSRQAQKGLSGVWKKKKKT